MAGMGTRLLVWPYLWAGACVLLLPFPWDLLPWHAGYVRLLAAFFLPDHPVFSDSKGWYLWVALLAVAALPVALWWPSRHLAGIRYWLHLLLTYYLALLLAKYGADKVFKYQFFLPEPNTLYTPLGMLDRDIAFWSVMGVSRGYNIFLGLTELVPALLLLVSRTRLWGALIAAAVLLHVLALNVAFGITVKGWSALLLMMALLVAAPELPMLWRWGVLREAVVLPLRPLPLSPFRYAAAKSLVISFLLAESLWPYAQRGQFDDDRAARPPLHGAYTVLTADTVRCLPWSPRPLRRIFVHRRGYLIAQDHDEHLQDWGLQVLEPQLRLTDHDGRQHWLHYRRANDTLLFWNARGDSLRTAALPWRQLPLLQAK